MQVIIEQGEAWSLMMLITSYAVDNSGFSQDGKQKLRRWRSDRAEGTVEMADLAVAMNETLGTYIDEQTNRQIRGRARFRRKRED